MATRKKQSGPKKAPQFSDGEHYNAIMIEDLKSNFKFVIEGLQNLRSEMHSRFDAAKSENNSRFDLIELTLKHHSAKFEEIDKRFEQVDKRFEQVDQRFELIDKRFEQVDKRFEQIDDRFDRLEFKMDRVANKVDAHDAEIAHLKTVL